MKKTILLFAIILATACQKEIEPLYSPTLGTWHLTYFKDWTGVVHTDTEPCWRDDYLFIREGWAIISQGDCKAVPDKPANIPFSWEWLPDGRANMGGDTVQTYVTDTTFELSRKEPFLLMKYKK